MVSRGAPANKIATKIILAAGPYSATIFAIQLRYSLDLLRRTPSRQVRTPYALVAIEYGDDKNNNRMPTSNMTSICNKVFT